MKQPHDGTTERHQKEVALAQAWSPVESAHLLRSTLDGLASHLAVLNDAGDILFTNTAYRDFADHNGADAATVSQPINYLAICDAAEGKDAQYAWEFAHGLRAVIAGTRRSFEMEYPCHAPDEQRWFVARVTRFSNDNSGLVIVAHENITDRKRSDDLLRRQMLRADALLKLPRLADELDEITFMHRGMELAEGLTESTTSFIHFVGDEKHPLKKSLPDEADPLQRFISVPVTEKGLVVMVAGVGNKPTEYTPFDSESVELVATAIWQRVRNIRNIIDRVETDATVRKLTRAVEQSDITIVITDRDGRIEYANPHFEKVSGYTVAEAIGLNPRILQSGDTPRETYVALWNTVLAGNEWRGELKNKRKDGTNYWENVIISPVRDSNGIISNFVAVKEDITEHKRLLAERTKLQSQLNHAQKMESVGRLAGGVAHDFNNLLTVITGTVELALSSPVPAETYKADLAAILQAAQRGTALTRQLLTFSRQSVVTARNVPINDVVTPMLSMLRRIVGEDVTIATELADDAGIVRVDVGQLEQVITNLAVNARDAMPRGGRITVSTAKVLARDTSGDTVRLTVRDTGTGMSDAVQDRLFEPFFTTKAVGKGTGLGLAIVYGIVTQSGGTVTVDSTLNVGTAFHVSLPSRDDAASAPREPERGGLVLGSGVILVVDDEPALGSITQRILQHAGYTVLLARSGSEAIHMAETLVGKIDLLISDVIMPEMYGPEVASVLRARDPHLRVMFVSGHSGDVLTNHGLEDRAYAFLAKPFSIPELTKKVQDVLAM